MSEAAFLREFDKDFFAAWACVTGGLSATYTPPGSVTPQACEVLMDRDVQQFAAEDDAAPVSIASTRATFRRAEVEPATGGTLGVDGVAWRLVQRVSGSDPSLSVWLLERLSP